MVKLARNEQCITLYPLTDHYSVGPFPARVIFRPYKGPFLALDYLWPVTSLFCWWANSACNYNRPVVVRFMIRNLIDVDDVSPATTLKIPLTWLDCIGISPMWKGWCSTTTVSISSVVKPRYQSSRRTKQHYVNGTCTQRTNTCNPARKRGCQSLLGKKIDWFVWVSIDRSL